MPKVTRTNEEKLAALKAQEQLIKAKQQKINARITGQERKNDTRRKIIAGAIALEHMSKNDDAVTHKLKALIDEYVTKDNERALFDLPPMKQPEKAD